MRASGRRPKGAGREDVLPHSLDLDLLSSTPIGSAGHASPRPWGCPADSADFRFVITHRACRACRRDRCYVGASPVALGCGRQSRTERSGGRVCRFPSSDLRRLVKSATCHGLRSPRAQGAGRSFFGWRDWLWHPADRTCDRSGRGTVADGAALDCLDHLGGMPSANAVGIPRRIWGCVVGARLSERTRVRLAIAGVSDSGSP